MKKRHRLAELAPDDAIFYAHLNLNPSGSNKLGFRNLVKLGFERRQVRTMVVAEAAANNAPMTEAPVISPRLRDRPSKPARAPRRSGATSIMTAVLLAAWNIA